MKTYNENRILQKIFLGIFLDSEKKMLLTQSSEWKQIKIDNSLKNVLKETQFQSKTYLGMYFSEAISLEKLEQAKTTIVNCMKTYCPKCDINQLKITVFAQILIE